MGLVFLDTETTGLDDDPTAELVELTYANNTQEPKTLYFGIVAVPRFVDGLIGFTARQISGRQSTPEEFNEFFLATNGQTMVAANPAFDKHFLMKNGIFYFHYRMLDIETYACAKLGHEEPMSMNALYNQLKDDLELVEPDHTSLNDVLAMRSIYYHLRDL